MNRNSVVTDILIGVMVGACAFCMWLTQQSDKSLGQLFIILLGFMTICFVAVVGAIRTE